MNYTEGLAPSDNTALERKLNSAKGVVIRHSFLVLSASPLPVMHTPFCL